VSKDPGEDRSAGRSEPAKMPEWGIDERHKELYFDCMKMKRIPCCCCNACPLDPKYPRLTVDPEDPDQKCTLSRARRQAIAAKRPGSLKYGGLTVHEWKWRRAWERLPAKEKERRKAVLLEARGRLHRPIRGKNDELAGERVEIPQTAAVELERRRARFEAALTGGKSRRAG